jgi:hypothetical protein
MTDELSSSYTSLFGTIDHAEGAEARSVLSPAAYLVDLLQLRDEVEGDLTTGFHDRRPDVKEIHLDRANTFTEVPYLDIANQVMRREISKVPGGAESEIASSIFPPPLPFSEQYVRLRLYAEKLGSNLEELYRSYAASADAHVAARLRLGLSEPEYDLFVTARDSEAGIKELWGVSDVAQLLAGNVDLIKKQLGLSLKQLKQLIRQDLGRDEESRAAGFFINQNGSYVVLDENARKLTLEPAAPAPNALTLPYLDRMMRFVRLARRLELEFAELDWILQSACNNQLDQLALQTIAIALWIRATYDLPLDEVCSLWSVPKNHGRGDGQLPADLFDRVYNNDFPVSLQDLVDNLAAAHATPDALDDRLQATVRLSGAEYAFLKSALLERQVAGPALAYAAVCTYFSGFRRFVQLSRMLSLSVQEMVVLVDVLDAQWQTSEHYDLAIPLAVSPQALGSSLLTALFQPSAVPLSALNVLQKLACTAQWLERRQLSVRQLAFICIEDQAALRQRLPEGMSMDGVVTDDEIEGAMGDLHETLRDTLLAPSALQTGSLTPNGARAVFESLRAARVLVTFGEPAQALIRAQPSDGELAAALESGIQERLEVHASDFGALGLTDLEPLFSLLVLHGYLERLGSTSNGQLEPRYSIAPGLQSFFSAASNLSSFALPNFEERAEAIFAALARQVDAARLAPEQLVAAGIEHSAVAALFEVLRNRSYVESLTGSQPPEYRIATNAQAFFRDAANAAKFSLPNFTVVFGVLAAKVETFQRAQSNAPVEMQELSARLLALPEQQTRVWLRSLSGLLGLSEDLAELVFAFAFGTPDEPMTQTLAALTLPLFAAKAQAAPALDDPYLVSRFRRIQQLALLLRKTGSSAEEARVYLENQCVHQALPEALKVPQGFLTSDQVDGLATLPNGNFLVLSGKKYAAFSRHDYHLLGTGTLDQLPDVTLPSKFRDRLRDYGIDAAFSDTGADGELVLQLCAGGEYVTVSASGSSDAKPCTEWGKVRNHIQQDARVDAALMAKDGRLFLFRGDQYFLYSKPEQLLSGNGVVDEKYPRAIRGKFEQEGVSALPSLMFSKLDAAFRDRDDTYYFFSGKRFTHSADPYQLREIRSLWGHVLNYLFEESRIDAAFVLGSDTYLTRKNQLTRYHGGAYQIVDEGYPISFGNVPESEPLLRLLRRFPNGLDAAFAGSDQLLYAFRSGLYASSAAPDQTFPIRDHWGRVRNVFIDNQRVDAALAHGGAVYLFCGDQYVRYSSQSYAFVDEGYPRRVRPNWNSLEKIGLIPDGLPLPITAVAVGRAPGASSDDVYFFGGDQFAAPGGALGAVRAAWARVRNNIERNGVVDAALIDGKGRLYLFSGDQFYRYGSPDQPFVDETYPRRLAGNWAQEGSGYALPDTFRGGISAALRAPDNRIFLFSGQQYARGDTAAPTRPIKRDWGVVRNCVASEGRVRAPFCAMGKTFLFGGDQFVRYSGAAYDFVDEGFPLAIGNKWGDLPGNFCGGIDAALAFSVDGAARLYLFKDREYVRYSTSDYSRVDAGYPKRLSDGTRYEGAWFRGLVVRDREDDDDQHGPHDHDDDHDEVIAVDAVYVDTYQNQPRICAFYRCGRGGGQWKREYRVGPGRKYQWGRPQPMETVDEYRPFKSIDGAFVGADGTLHLFSGERYAFRGPQGGPLSEPVPTRDRWARVWNQFAELSRVDATLDTKDGRTYLFCAQQFIRYSGALKPGDERFFVDEGYPKRIAGNWLAEGVAMALVDEFPAQAVALCREANGKVHFFNGQRYTSSASPGADILLSSRWGRVENRFQELNRVDGAYRAENDALYLFCDNQYTRYSGPLQPGAAEFYADEGYPRRIATGWAGEGLLVVMPQQWNALGSAVFRDAQDTYVFSGANFASSRAPQPAPIIPHWANVRNQLQAQNRVDAGFAFDRSGATLTLLFCDDQYVRYSGGYGGFVDEGYPKVIARLPATEGLFAGLPSAFQSQLRATFVGTDGTLHFFGAPPASAGDPQLHLSSAQPSSPSPLNQQWGIIDNALWDDEFVNAALLDSGGRLYLFSRDQYLRYSGADRTHVDEGYPRRVASAYAQEIGVTALAPALSQGIDAALSIGGTSFYFAKDQYVGTDHPESATPLVERWGLVENQLQTQGIDAGFVAPNGKLYVFGGEQYAVYSGAGRQYIDEEFPRKLATDIGQLWPHDGADFRANLDAAAAFEGRSYLFKREQHVRISDFHLEHPDTGYPLKTSAKLVDRFDFELGDLPDVWRIAALFANYSFPTSSMLEYLDQPQAQPVQALARATQWAAPEIDALAMILGLDPSELSDGGVAARLARCFELADRMGTTPSKLKPVWDGIVDSDVSKRRAIGDFLYGLIRSATSAKDWPDVYRKLLDPLNTVRREALVAYLVHSLSKHDANDLYEQLLTDVQMSAAANTSNIVEAINSIQLYYHRALMQLEAVTDNVWSKLKAWWPWMKNYRIWEANRRVFLHPENYIRPELRPEKSAAFMELEQ